MRKSEEFLDEFYMELDYMMKENIESEMTEDEPDSIFGEFLEQMEMDSEMDDSFEMHDVEIDDPDIPF